MRLRLADTAYTPDALVDAGLPAALVKRLMADGPRAVPERARVAVTGRKRTVEPTRHYVWGPDARTLLDCPAQAALLPTGISTMSRAAL